MQTTPPLGVLLRRYRLARGLTQEELADRAHVSIRSIGTIERGDEHLPRKDTIQLLAEALDLSPEQRDLFLAAARHRVASARSPQSRGQRPLLSPLLLAPLIGREQEMAVITRLLPQEDVRLLTLTGPGGVGKTRLAVEAAASLAHMYADGVAIVELATLRAEGMVASTIVQRLGIRETETRSPPDVLLAHLHDKHFLLVLDNFEHVLDAAPLLPELLTTCPQLTILVTSREALRVHGEREYFVPPLSPGASEALFVARVRAIKSDFALSPANTFATAEICRRLDGLPLAIELAAARVRHLPLSALRLRLERRLPLLTQGTRDVPGRQRTMRDTIAWSYNLLTPAEQQVFAQLSVFVGGWTLEATQAVCPAVGDGDVLTVLTSLVDKHLVRAAETAVGDTRFTMLQTIREYAHEQLTASGCEEASRAAHARYCLSLAEQADAELRGVAQHVWIERLEIEHDNLRAALQWALDRCDGDCGLRLAGALWWFWYMRGHWREGCGWCARVLAQTTDEAAVLRIKVLNGMGFLLSWVGQHARARVVCEEGLTLAECVNDAGGVAGALDGLTCAAFFRGDFDAACAFGVQSLTRYRDLGDPWRTGFAADALGYAVWRRGRYAEAMTLFDEAREIFIRLGDRWNLAYALYGLADVAFNQGDGAIARQRFEEMLAITKELGDVWIAIRCQLALGYIALSEGDVRPARATFTMTIPTFETMGDSWSLAAALHGLAVVAGREARPATAAQLLGAAAALSSPGESTTMRSVYRDLYEQTAATARSALGPQGFAEAWATGRAMTLAQVIAREGTGVEPV